MRLNERLRHFILDVHRQTPFLRLLVLLIAMWLLFSSGMYFAERDADGSAIHSLGEALYWGVAACSTAGIADAPVTDLGRLLGGLWIVLGSILFFGAIVATITAYFMRPLQRPVRQLVDTIEYNLEQVDRLSLEELEILKDTTDALILHMEHLRAAREPDEPRP
jgi:voltage-gated potassium channel